MAVFKWDWRSLGFRSRPSMRVSEGGEILYRAWSGDPLRRFGSSSLPGVHFSLDRVTTRAEAEMRFSVMEWGNAVNSLSSFRVEPGVPLWIGEVDPGDRRALLGGCYGSQAFVERAHLCSVKYQRTFSLSDDVSPFYLAPRAGNA